MATTRQKLTVDNSKIIFVSGYSGPEGVDLEYVEECWWKLQSYIYNLTPNKRREQIKNCLYVTNKSSTLIKVDNGNVRELQQMLLDMPVNGVGITRIIFGHSHGAKVVYEALKAASLVTFLKSKGVREPGVKSMNIRSHLAVFTIGGIQDIPRGFAEICWNLVLTIDVVAKTGMKLFAEKHGQNANLKEIETVDAAVKELAAEPPAITIVKLILAKCGSFFPSGSGLLASAASNAASGTSAKHFCHYYATNDEIMQEVCRFLGLLDDSDLL